MHQRQPLMAWCVSNARLEQRANGILITKQASGTAKRDRFDGDESGAGRLRLLGNAQTVSANCRGYNALR